MIKVGVVGGTGYTGVELLRLLAGHPDVRITAITSRGEAGTPVATLFPTLRSHIDLSFSDPASTDLTACDCVFFATPNGVAMGQVRPLLDAGVKVVDLSADFRLKDIETWERWYKMKHTAADLVAKAVYGLPEINRDKIRAASLVANPGCYATAVQLALLPLVETDFVDRDHLVADSKSGVSGAGRKAEVDLLFSEASDNFKAYAVSGHRHHPEIVQSLREAGGRKIGLTFVPHLVPMIRGILATVYARVTRETDFQRLFETRYAAEAFVDVLPPGTQPETRWVRGSNMCRIAVHRPMGADTLVVLAVEDNLVKGAAGQAVQNMNLVFGLPEGHGPRAGGAAAVRGFTRRLRSNFGIRSSRMTIRSHLAWYWRWLLNILMMAAVAGVVWWVVENSYRITGFNQEEAKQHIATLEEENSRFKRDLETARAAIAERDRQLAIDKAAQLELARNVTQLQDENAVLKEDLGFLRNIMSSGTTPEGLGVANLKVEQDGQSNEFRYRMLLTQGGQRKQDFKGRIQLLVRVANQGALSTLTFPDPSAGEGAGVVEFRFYQKVEGRFRIPEGALLKGYEIRVIALPGGQVKLSRTVNVQ